MENNTQRFSNRVNDYVKYRPAYPTEIIPFLEQAIGLRKDSVIADIGSGTGIFAKNFLDYGNTVYAVEPNTAMRHKAEELLQEYSNFISINATAEQTNLQDGAADLVTAAQAFHWFEVSKTKAEFKRILKPGGYCCLVWNERHTTSSFEQAYEQLLFDYSLDYSKVDHKNINDKIIADFYAPAQFIKQSFGNKQVFDFESLKGRLLSSSYAPDKDHPKHNAMIESLRKIFDRFNQNNTIEFRYDTKLYVGRL